MTFLSCFHQFKPTLPKKKNSCTEIRLFSSTTERELLSGIKWNWKKEKHTFSWLYMCESFSVDIFYEKIFFFALCLLWRYVRKTRETKSESYFNYRTFFWPLLVRFWFLNSNLTFIFGSNLFCSAKKLFCSVNFFPPKFFLFGKISLFQNTRKNFGGKIINWTKKYFR
jgi:hypothetical protein